ncbi:MAG: hypothetical protein WAO71_14890 [Gallionella sp.]
MEVYNSKYLHIAFFAEQRLIEATWLSATKTMNTDECKQEFLNYLSVVHIQKPFRLIVDSSNMYFTLSAEMQTWVNQNILMPLSSLHGQKIAFVISNDFFAKLSGEQLMNEKGGLNFNSRYFDNKEAAKQWVLSAA